MGNILESAIGALALVVAYFSGSWFISIATTPVGQLVLWVFWISGLVGFITLVLIGSGLFFLFDGLFGD